MAIDFATANFLSGVAVEVHPTDIERELASLWKPASEETGGQDAVVRACLANLVIYLEGPGEQERVARILPKLSSRHPNRTLLLLVQDGAGARQQPPAPQGRSRLRAWVTAMCHAPAPGTAPVCCEQISLVARPGEESLLAGAVAPLLVPDIPVFLWWLGDYRSGLLHRIEKFADRLIVDSRRPASPASSRLPEQGRAPGSGAPPAGSKARSPRGAEGCPSGTVLQEILDLCETSQIQEVVDLGWRGLQRWRQAVADLFDDPAIRRMAGEIDRIEVEQAPSGGSGDCPVSQSALLIGWLAARLKWNHQSGACAAAVAGDHPGAVRTARFKTASGKAAEALVRTRREFPAGGAVQAGEPILLRLGAGGGPTGSRPERYVKIAVHEASQNSAQVSFQALESCKLPGIVAFRHASDAELLGEVLNSTAHPFMFRDALRIAARIVE